MKVWKLVVSIIIPLVTGGISGYLTSGEIQAWFITIEKPSFNPPDAVFGPVWTCLYILMGIAFYVLWIKNDTAQSKRRAMIFYFIQLLLNFCWSLIFFSAHEIGWALVEIIVLLLMILFTMLAFGKVSKSAMWLLLPYLLWVSFATVLNYAIWRLN